MPQEGDVDADHDDVQWCLTEAGLDDDALEAMERQDDADIHRLETLLSRRRRAKSEIGAMRGRLRQLVPKFTWQQRDRNSRVQRRISGLQTRLRAAQTSGTVLEAALASELAAHQQTCARVAELEAECRRLQGHAAAEGFTGAGGLSPEASLQVLTAAQLAPLPHQ